MSSVLVRVLQFVQTAHHVVIKHVVVPDWDKERKAREQQALYTSYVWEEIKNVVTTTVILFGVHIHFNEEIELCIQVPVVGAVWLSVNCEYAFVCQLSYGIKVHEIIL